MRRAAAVVALALLFAGGYALAQSQGWSADQDGSQFKLYNVTSVETDTNAGNSLSDPAELLFSPALSSASVKISRSAQNGLGGLTLSCDNQAGFLDLAASQNHLLMTAQGFDNGGETFYGASYFGMRSDGTASYPGNRDYQQVYFAPKSIYEFSGSVVTPVLNGTTMLSPYFFRGETIGLDGTAGNNTRPDGISLGFFWDQPSIVALHGFTATSYQTGEIFGPPCSGPTCYGLRIYGGSSDNSERVAGTYVADGLGGSGTRCVQVDNTGTMAVAAGACGSGAGTVTSVTGTAAQILCTPSSPNPVCSLIATAVTPGSYTNTSLTVDALGRLTAASNGTAPVTSIGVTDPITTTGGATPTIGAKFDNVSITLNGGGGLQRAAISGDGTIGVGVNTFALTNIPNDTTMAGDVLATAIVAPSTPAAGKGRIYEDSTSKNLSIKNDAGTVNHGAQTVGSSAGVALTGLSDAGGWTTQTFQAPLTACTDYVSVSCQTGATDIGGTNATTTVIGIETNAAMRGDLLATNIGTPAVPATGKILIYGNSGADNAMMERHNGNVTHMMQTAACGSGQFFSGSADDGTFTCSSTGIPSYALNYNYLDLSIIGGFGGLWAIAGPVGMGNTDGNAYEYSARVVATKVRISGYVSLYTLSAIGLTTLTFQVTRNGSNVTGAFINPTSTGVFDSGLISVASGAATDTWGMQPGGSNTGGGVITLTVTVTLYQ